MGTLMCEAVGGVGWVKLAVNKSLVANYSHQYIIFPSKISPEEGL